LGARIGGQRACAATTTTVSTTTSAASTLGWESRGAAAGLGVSRDGEEEEESCNANRSFHSHLPFSAMNDHFCKYNGNCGTREDR
jgi:hypothetical protein